MTQGAGWEATSGSAACFTVTGRWSAFLFWLAFAIAAAALRWASFLRLKSRTIFAT